MTAANQEETREMTPDRTERARPRILPLVRHAFILKALAANGAVQVQAIASELGISEMTVRRDLMDLEAAGRLLRIHGGAVDVGRDQPAGIDREEPHFEARLLRNHDAKTRIATTALRLAQGCRTVALDVGTTTFLLARMLRNESYTKIFTNSVRIAAELGSDPVDVYLPGGQMRHGEMAIGGTTAIEQFQALWFDVSFVGISGLTSGGFYDYSFEDTELKRVYLRRSSLRVVLCDSSKFQRISLVRIASLQDFDVLVTDAAPPPAIASALSDANVKVEIATN